MVTGSSLEAMWADQHLCRAQAWNVSPLNLTLDSCGVVCESDLPDRGHLNRTLRTAHRSA